MAIPKCLQDLAVISKLGDNPGSDNNLTTSAFRAKFDEAALAIQNYINNTLIPAINPLVNPTEGLTMSGPINMNKKALTGLKTPTADDDAVPLGYAKEYLRAKNATVSLPASGWSGAVPYTQTVAVAGILKTDSPLWGLTYSGDGSNYEAEEEAFAMVKRLETADGSVTFTCFAEKPGVDLTIWMEVNR